MAQFSPSPEHILFLWIYLFVQLQKIYHDGNEILQIWPGSLWSKWVDDNGHCLDGSPAELFVLIWYVGLDDAGQKLYGHLPVFGEMLLADLSNRANRSYAVFSN